MALEIFNALFFLFRKVYNCNVRTFPGKHLGCSSPDTRITAGNDGLLALQLPAASVFLQVWLAVIVPGFKLGELGKRVHVHIFAWKALLLSFYICELL